MRRHSRDCKGDKRRQEVPPVSHTRIRLPEEAGIQAHVHKSAETIQSQTMPWNAGSWFEHNANEVEVTGMISFLPILAETSALCPQAA